MKTVKLTFVLFLIAMVAWNCSDSTSVNNNSWNPDYHPYAAAKKVAPADSTIGLAKQIAGFGGLFIKSEKLAIYLTNPADQKTKAKKVLKNSEFITTNISDNVSAPISDMIIQKGQFTYVDLYNWNKKIAESIYTIEGVYSTGIDQSRNRLSIGVKNKKVRDRVRTKLSDLNIPTKAILFFRMSEPEFY